MFNKTKICFSNILVTLFLASSLSSCATIKENLGIEPPEISGAGMGAATGAAVGATAGAIIGSTSGNAGEGLLLGGGVGAVSGAVIGSELGERDQEYASHQRTLDSQERQIRYQNRQLDKVRGSTFDTSGKFVIPQHNRPSRGSSSYAYQRASISQAVSVTKTEERTTSYAGNSNVASQLRARLTPSVIAPPTTKTVLAKGGELNQTASVGLPKSAEKKETTIKKDLNSLENKSVKTQEIANNEVKKQEAKVEKEKQTAKTEVAKVAPAKTEESSANTCSEAEGEAQRARTAATDTDKIFYYRRALRLCKSKPEYHVEMGKVYSSIGRKEEAEFEFSKALEIDPNNRDAQDELTVLMLDSAN